MRKRHGLSAGTQNVWHLTFCSRQRGAVCKRHGCEAALGLGKKTQTPQVLSGFAAEDALPPDGMCKERCGAAGREPLLLALVGMSLGATRT